MRIADAPEGRVVIRRMIREAMASIGGGIRELARRSGIGYWSLRLVVMCQRDLSWRQAVRLQSGSDGLLIADLLMQRSPLR